MFAANLPAAFVAVVCVTGVAFLHRRDRGWRRLTSNTCPKCTYPLTGLKPDAPCPECGAGRAVAPEAIGATLPLHRDAVQDQEV